VGHHKKEINPRRNHHPIELCRGRSESGWSDIQEHSLDEKDQSPPMLVQAKLDEEKLPPLLKYNIAEFARCNNDDVRKENDKTKAIYHDCAYGKGQHRIPFVLVANDCQVFFQRQLAVRIILATEETH
jgi:hypothetical protein